VGLHPKQPWKLIFSWLSFSFSIIRKQLKKFRITQRCQARARVRFRTIPNLPLASRHQGAPLPLHPKRKKIMQITRKRKNKTFAIPADAAAMPPNPNTAAITAMIRKVIAQPNIMFTPFKGKSHQQIAMRVL
jgi:hypothetical protein